MPEPTEFAPAERMAADDILTYSRLFVGSLAAALLNALPLSVLVISETRQVIYCNPVFARLAEQQSIHDILGLRPGEALGCIHSEAEGGCGTTRFCRHCGAAQAILKGLDGAPSTNECHIRRQKEDGEHPLALQVFTSPVNWEDRNFILFSALDISHERQLQFMERFFFHDLLNLVTSINYSAQALNRKVSPEVERYGSGIYTASLQLARELKNHQTLLKAERGELAPSMEAMEARELLEKLQDLADAHCSGSSISVSIAFPTQALWVRTDRNLILRVLGNMVTNAVEAAEEEERIAVGIDLDEDHLVFRVSNKAVMEDSVKAHVFKRFVSTKGEGRGLGTYGMKLLGEKYLGGEVSFSSEAGQGTVFRLTLPMVQGPSGDDS